MEKSRYNSNSMINIGQRIKIELELQDRSISWLARKLNRNRSVVYRILNKNSIDTGLLVEISNILNHDFFMEYVDNMRDDSDKDAFE